MTEDKKQTLYFRISATPLRNTVRPTVAIEIDRARCLLMLAAPTVSGLKELISKCTVAVTAAAG